MSKLPKLRVKLLVGHSNEEIRDFEQAKCLPFCHHILIFVEGQVINSYEEFVQLAALDCYKEKESLEVLVTPAMGGG